MEERKLQLQTGPRHFNIFFSSEDKALIIAWAAETEAQNLTWMRLATVKWRWPPIKVITCFTDFTDTGDWGRGKKN